MNTINTKSKKASKNLDLKNRLGFDYRRRLRMSMITMLMVSFQLIANTALMDANFIAPSVFVGPGGIIINEVSNGPSGLKEWVELLVVGDPSNPSALVDLTNWIIDDNNGEFKGSSGAGVASGYLILGAAYNAVAPGSIILIYNHNDPDPNLPSDDPTDANGDDVYVIPSDHTSLHGCITRPTTSDITYLPCTLVAGNWSRVVMRNGGDAIQTRQPDGTFYHGFSFGDVGTPFPNFPSGTSSFNAGTGGTGSTFSLQCGDWESSAQYLRSDATGRTPGLANSTANQNLIDNISNGAFDYSNLSASSNCIMCKQPICLPITYTKN